MTDTLTLSRIAGHQGALSNALGRAPSNGRAYGRGCWPGGPISSPGSVGELT